MTATVDTMLAQAPAPDAPRADPPWYEEYRNAWRSAESHAFIVTGQIEGHAYEDVGQRLLLLANLSRSFDVVAVWHLASGGITIFGADVVIMDDDGKKERGTCKQIALRILGADTPPPAGGVGAAGKLAAAAGPQAQASDPLKAAQQPGQALPVLQKLLQEGARMRNGKRVGMVAVVIDYADALVPAPPMPGKGAMSPDDRKVLVTLLSWAKDERIGRANGNPIFLLARQLEDVHPDLRASDSGWKPIKIAPPTREERLEYIRYYLEKRELRRRPVALLDALTPGEFANLTAGLNLRNIEDIILNGATGGGVGRALLKRFKDDIVTREYSEVAEMIEPLPGGFDDLGGMEIFKAFAKRRIIDPVRQGRPDDVAKGLLLIGPPGTGKTYGVRGLARELGFSAVALNSAKILGGIVGQSERNLERFFQFARSLAPVVIFMDEVDQSDVSQRGNNSGNPVAKNLFSAMLQFLSDETMRGKAIVIFGSNRPDLLDPALIRSGRIDAIIPILLPNAAERRSVAAVQAATSGARIDADALDLLAEGTEGWNNADLGAAVREARLEAEGGTITTAHIRIILDDIVPSGLEEAKGYTLLAIKAVNRRRNLPPEYAELRVAPEQLKAQLAEATMPGGYARGGREERDWDSR